jgi:hypothetical protein
MPGDRRVLLVVDRPMADGAVDAVGAAPVASEISVWPWPRLHTRRIAAAKSAFCASCRHEMTPVRGTERHAEGNPLLDIGGHIDADAVIGASAFGSRCCSLRRFLIVPSLIAKAPIEPNMGLIQKIFYFHVPCAIMLFLSDVRVRRRRDRVPVQAIGAR